LIARRIDDRSREIDEPIRQQAISRLLAIGSAEETIRLVSKYVPPERVDAVRSFGESLPSGLQLVSAPNCLLSVPAFHSSGLTFSKPEWTTRQVARDLGSTVRAAETISLVHIRSEWASGKPHKKSAAEAPKRGHLATMVFTGGKLKFSAQFHTQ
jgi:hypothetical protein